MGIPVTIVSGFLGSGKTTLINQALDDIKSPKEEIIIIENEFGETGIDHELLLHTEEQVLQLNNGCMCCSLRKDLITTLMNIRESMKDRKAPISKIIIETTGIADPQPIIQTILTTPKVKNLYYIDSILTVVDAHNLSNYKNEDVSVKQIALADRIFLSLKDEADKKNSAEIFHQIEQINPLADRLYFSEKVPIHSNDFFSLNKFQAAIDFVDTIHSELTSTGSTEYSLDHAHSHSTHHHNIHGFQSLLLTTDIKLNKDLLTRWIDSLIYSNEKRLYRFKGIVAIQDYDLAMSMQGVNKQVSFELTGLPCIATKIVLIGKNLDSNKIEQAFKHLCMACDQ